jgi:glycosyltransferase involved in cell wall biosynthesis
MIKDHFPDKTNFIPHALPESLFHPLSKEEIDHHKSNLFGQHNKDAFVLFWVNRNARRKRPGDLLWAWKKFIDRIEKEGSQHQNPILCLHTDPNDHEGPNLLAVAENFNITSSCFFSNQRIEFEKMNILHNVADACINISYAEGFGLATLEAMQCGKPIIAVKTGGLTRQVIDHRDGSVNGIALDVDFQSCVGSQSVPFIFEDYATVDKIADAIYEMYMMSDEERKKIGEKASNYVKEEFSLQKTIDLWDKTLHDTITAFKEKPTPRWTINEVGGAKS